MVNTFTDSTSLHAVESLFHKGNRDPWAISLAGRLADLFIYSDEMRYPVPVRGTLGDYDLVHLDSLLGEMAKRGSEIFRPERYSTAEPRQIADEYLQKAFSDF